MERLIKLWRIFFNPFATLEVLEFSSKFGFWMLIIPGYTDISSKLQNPLLLEKYNETNNTTALNVAEISSISCPY